jgi:hypothetical protein
VGEAASTVVTPVADAAGSVTAPVADVVEPIAAPLDDTASPVVAPASDTVETITAPIGDPVAVVTDVLPPADGATAPLAGPVPAVDLPSLDTAVTGVAADITAGVDSATAAATLPVETSATGTVADVPGQIVADGASAAGSDAAVGAVDGTVAAGPELDSIIDPSLLAQLTSIDSRVGLVGAIALVGAGHASGIGTLAFADSVLYSCASRLRLAFDAVTLTPCVDVAAAGVGAVRLGESVLTSPTTHQAASSRGSRHRRAPAPGTQLLPSGEPVLRRALDPRWLLPRVDGSLFRMLAGVLAAISGVVAFGAGMQLERRERRHHVYRRRVHS